MSGRRRERGDGAFRLLIRLLPSEFRESFGDEMHAAFRADHDDALRGGSRGGRLRFWWRTVAGIFRTAPREHLDALRMDSRFALRMMRRRLLFTLTATLSLAVGIGAMTTVVAVFTAAFVRNIPGVEDPHRLVNVKPKKSFEETFLLTSYPNYLDLREGDAVLADLAGFHGLSLSLGVEPAGEPEVVFGQLVTANYFPTLGVRPAIGRFFEAREDREDGAGPVAVLSAWLWKERFGGDRSVLGREIRLNGTLFTVIGVAPEGFRGHFVGFNFDVFVPTSMAGIAGHDRRDRGANWVELIGRLRDDVSVEQTSAAMDLAAGRLARAHPAENRGLEIQVEPSTGIDSDLRGGFATFLVILLGVSGFVLLIACVNVANMLLTHVLSRRRELALRLALGAPRGRMTRQLLTESLLLSLLAGGLGTLLAVWATWAARSTLPRFGGRVSLGIEVDGWTLAAALGISLLTALLFGLAPALRAGRADLATVLRQSSGQVGSGSRAWKALVVAQVVLSLVVLICAGLFLRVLHHAGTLDPGFRSENVHIAGLNPALIGLDEDRSARLLRDVLERARSVPGVQAASLVSRVPLSLGSRIFANPLAVEVPGWEPPPGQDAFLVEHGIVSDGYFETLQIPLAAGRAFEGADRMGRRPVAVVNEAFVRRFFESRDVLGRRFVHDGNDFEIVGVARDSKYRRLDEEALPYIYLPFDRHSPASAALLVRHDNPEAAFPEELRAAIREAAPHLPLQWFSPLADRLEISLLPQRIAAGVASVLGLIGLLLTAVGLHGVVAYSVSRRTGEIGVRMSLGARPSDIVKMLLRQGLVLAVIGLGIGIPVAATGAQLLGSFLVGRSPVDVFTYVVICLVLLGTSVVACYLPARRAARIDPSAILKLE